MNHRLRAFAYALLSLAALMFPPFLRAASVLMISIDGMRPDYVTQADAHHLKIPNLRRMLVEGSYAEGVIPVTPTVTYPNHTTLVTGVMPAAHGIYANQPFDPLRVNKDGWYWYAVDVRVPTLWQAVSAAGRVTASVEWPATVNARGIEYNLPEYRRAYTDDDIKLDEALARPEGLLQELEARLGRYTSGAADDASDDAVRTRFAAQIIRERKPAFMTMHLISLDGESHKAGPFSPRANGALEMIDGMVGTLASAWRANGSDSIVAIVSDHGFASVTHVLNWRIPFIAAGLIDAQDSRKWQATLWGDPAAAVMLRNPADDALKSRVRVVLAQLASDPANGVSQVLEGQDIRALGAWPDAAFVIGLKAGFAFGGESEGPLVRENPGGGTHGYLATEKEMRAAFMMTGEGVPHGRDLGTIDMRSIAPTLAKMLGVPLARAELPALELR